VPVLRGVRRLSTPARRLRTPADAEAGRRPRRHAPAARGAAAWHHRPWHGRSVALPLARRVSRHPRRHRHGGRTAWVQPDAQLETGARRRLPDPPSPHRRRTAGAAQPGARRGHHRP